MANPNKISDIDAYYDADAATDAELMQGIGSFGSEVEMAEVRGRFQEQESASQHMGGLAVEKVIGGDADIYDYEPVDPYAKTSTEPNIVETESAVNEAPDQSHAA